MTAIDAEADEAVLAEGINRRLVDKMLDVPGAGLRDLRNRTLLAVAYDTLGRRAELVGLLAEDLVLASDGHGTVTVRRSRTDQEGEGAECYLAPDTVRLVREWMAAAAIERGPLFRSVLKGGRVGKAVHPGDVAHIFKELAQAAGLLPVMVDRISAHSSRVGAAQDMVASDRIELPAIMQAGRWKSPQMVALYTRRQTARRSGAAKTGRVAEPVLISAFSS